MRGGEGVAAGWTWAGISPSPPWPRNAGLGGVHKLASRALLRPCALASGRTPHPTCGWDSDRGQTRSVVALRLFESPRFRGRRPPRHSPHSGHRRRFPSERSLRIPDDKPGRRLSPEAGIGATSRSLGARRRRMASGRRMSAAPNSACQTLFPFHDPFHDLAENWGPDGARCDRAEIQKSPAKSRFVHMVPDRGKMGPRARICLRTRRSTN